MHVEWISHPVVIVTSWAEVLTFATFPTLVAMFVTAYKHIECHQDKCHRLGRFTHGHYKLCHVHHPLVPSDGRITAEHIARVKP